MVISCSATRALIEASASKGLDVDAMIEGCGYTSTYLRDPRNRIDWETFARLNDRAGELCAGRVTLLEVGAAMIDVPGYQFTRSLAGCILTPMQFYRFVYRWLGPAQFPNIACEGIERSDGSLLLKLTLAEGDRPSEAYFQLCAGSLGQLPTMLGYDPARVTLTLEGRRATFLIEPPHTQPFLKRVRQIARAVVSGPSAMRVLVSQQEALKTSYEALLRTRQNFRQVIETMSDTVLIQREGRVVWANRAFLEPFGYTRVDQVLGRSVLGFVHPEDRPMVAARLAEPIDPKASPLDCRLLCGDGTVLTLEIAPTQDILYEGESARLVVGRDRTERKRFQEQLLLADRMATVGVLAAGVAHEINNPLAYVTANLELARKTAEDLGGPGRVIADALHASTDGIERVTAIVRDLKMLSRADAPSEITAIDVRALVQSTVTIASKQLARKARVVIDSGPRIMARGNRGRLGQVLLNLLLNAAEAILEGDPQSNEIRIAIECHEGTVAITVHDTGPGIPEATLDRIFDPFFTTKPPGEGTGLGLSICHRIITDLGGTITATSGMGSRVGTGATFRVTLPEAAPDEPIAEESRRTPPLQTKPTLQRARILVIDDEPLLRNVLRTVLEDTHEVVLTGEGAKAIELLLSNTEFDVVLCDLMMADVTGMDVYEAARTRRPGLERRFLFMTGGAFTTRGRQFLTTVPNRCLEKPFDAKEVLEAIEEHLRDRDEQTNPTQ